MPTGARSLRRSSVSLLFSYAYLRNNPFLSSLLVPMAELCDVLVDSGAFTNHSRALRVAARAPTTGDAIELGTYIEFCRTIHGKVWQYIALDVLREQAATQANLETMLAAGLTPMPVLVGGADVSVVPSLASVTGTLCVAGGTSESDKYLHARFIETKRLAPDVLIHALGFVRWPDVLRLPISTCDVSSWYGGDRFGTLKWFAGREGLQGAQWRKAQTQDTISRLLSYNIAPAVLRDPKHYRGLGSINTLTTTNAYLDMGSAMSRQGRTLFLVVATCIQLDTILAVLATKTGDVFDWQQSRVVLAELRALSKRRDVDAYVQRAREIIGRASA